MASRDDSPAPDEAPQEGTFCTLRLIKKLDGTEINRYPVDGEKTTFGRDETNDIRLYYADVSRFHCEIVFDAERRAQLNVLGTKGVEVNGRLVLPPTTVELREGDTLEVRKKRFSITFPTAQELIQIVKAEAHTPRRRRPSSRMSLMPKDILVSPYAARDALAAAVRLQTPSKPSSRLVSSYLPTAEEREPEEPEVKEEEEIEEEVMQAEAEEWVEEAEEEAEEEYKEELEEEVRSEEEEDESMEQEEEDVEEDSFEGSEDKENAQPSAVSASPRPFLTPQPARSSQSRAHPASSLVPRTRLVHFGSPVQLASTSAPQIPEESDGDSFEEDQSGSASEGDAEGKVEGQEESGSEEEEAELEADEGQVLLEPSDEEASDEETDVASDEEFVEDEEEQEVEAAEPTIPRTPRSLPLPASADTPYQSTPAKASPSAFPSSRSAGTPSFKSSTPSKQASVEAIPAPATPSSLPLPDPSATPYHAAPPSTPSSSRTPNSPKRSPSRQPSTPNRTPPRKPMLAPTPKLLSAKKKGPSSLRKAILMRSAKKVLMDDLRREELERIRNSGMEAEEEEEEGNMEEEGRGTEEEDDGMEVDAAQIPLPESPAPLRVVAEEVDASPSLASSTNDEELEQEEGDDSDEEVERSLVEDEASWEDDDESGGEEEQEEEEVLQPMVVQEEEEDLHEEEEEEAMEEDSDEEVDRSGDESIEAEEEEEAVVPDVAPPVQNLPALPTTPSVVPVSKTFYTPQVSRPDRSRQDLTRTMGPPVRVPASVGARGPVDRLLQSRPNLGSPIRAPKTRVVEDEVEVEDAVAVSERPSEPFASRRESIAIIASGPRPLPAPSGIDFKGLYSSPRKLVAPVLDRLDATSDEEPTPLQSPAKNAELLRRKSLASGPLGMEPASTSLDQSPRRMSTPFLLHGSASASPSQSRTSTPIKLGQSSLAVEQIDSPLSEPSSSKIEPPTPDMSGIKHLYPSAPAAGTPRLGGLKDMFREAATSTAETPRFSGMRTLFQTSAESSTPRYNGVRELLKTPRQAPATPLDAHYSSIPTLFTSTVDESASPDAQQASTSTSMSPAQPEQQAYVSEDLYDEAPAQDEIPEAVPEHSNEEEQEEADRSRAETDDEGEEEPQEGSREEEEAIEEPAVEIIPKSIPVKATRSRTRSGDEPVITLPPVRRARAAPKSTKAEVVSKNETEKPKSTRTRKTPAKASPVDVASTPLADEPVAELKSTRTRTKAVSTPAEAPAESTSRLPTQRTRTVVKSNPEEAAPATPISPPPKATRSKRVPTPPTASAVQETPMAAPPVKAIPRLSKRTTVKKEPIESTPISAVSEPQPSHRTRTTTTKVKAEPIEDSVPPATTSRSTRNALSTASKLATPTAAPEASAPAKKTTRKVAGSSRAVSEEDKENSPETPSMPQPSTTTKTKPTTASKLPSRASTRKAAPVAAVEEEAIKATTRSTRARK